MQFTAEMIAGLLNGTIVGDKSATVSTVSSIDGGKAGSLAYLTNPKYAQYLYIPDQVGDDVKYISGMTSLPA